MEKLSSKAWTQVCKSSSALGAGISGGLACGEGEDLAAGRPNSMEVTLGHPAFSSSGLLCGGGVEWLELLCQVLSDLLSHPPEACPAGAKERGCSLPPAGRAGWLCGLPEPPGSGVPTVFK